MTDHYRLLQLGSQLYELGMDIHLLEKKLTEQQAHGTLSSEYSLRVYRQLTQKQTQWKSAEQQYHALKARLMPAKSSVPNSESENNPFK